MQWIATSCRCCAFGMMTCLVAGNGLINCREFLILAKDIAKKHRKEPHSNAHAHADHVTADDAPAGPFYPSTSDLVSLTPRPPGLTSRPPGLTLRPPGLTSRLPGSDVTTTESDVTTTGSDVTTSGSDVTTTGSDVTTTETINE